MGEYMQELADSISDIPQKTQDVIDTANDSNIVGTRKAMSLSLEGMNLTRVSSAYFECH
jgi:hypothetical protein